MYKLIFLLVPLIFISIDSNKNTIENEQTESIDIIRFKDLDPTNAFPWSDILNSEIEIIKLETNDDSFIAEISKLLITESSIIIYDQVQKSVFIFERNGKFLFKLIEGEGPVEIREPRDFALDKNEILHVLSYKEIVQYDLNGNYINRLTFDYTKDSEFGYCNPLQFGLTKHGYYLWGGTFGRSDFTSRPVFMMYQTDEKFQILKTYFKAERKLLEYSRFRFNDDAYILKPKVTSDTLYMADIQGTVKASYLFDFNDRSIQSNLDLFSDKQEHLIMKDANSKHNLCFSTRSIFHSENYIFFEYGCDNWYQALYDKSSSMVVNGLAFLDSQFIDYIDIKCMKNNDLVFTLSPQSLIKNIEQMTTDNRSKLPDYQRLILEETKTLDKKGNPIICIASVDFKALGGDW